MGVQSQYMFLPYKIKTVIILEIELYDHYLNSFVWGKFPLQRNLNGIEEKKKHKIDKFSKELQVTFIQRSFKKQRHWRASEIKCWEKPGR